MDTAELSFPPFSIDRQLYCAVSQGNAPKVFEILEKNPGIDINQLNQGGWTFLSRACHVGNVYVVDRLLKHPKIDVNFINGRGYSALFYACDNLKCFISLLEDPRLRIAKHYNEQWFLRHAATGQCPIVVWHWLVSGKPMAEVTDEFLFEVNTAGVDQWLLDLLRRIKNDPEEARRVERLGSSWFDEAAAEIFSQVVFLCDGLLKVPPSGGAARFFQIAQKLPLELQMVLCHRTAGSSKINIPVKEREQAFRHLAIVCD
jgi:hypothetical protein